MVLPMAFLISVRRQLYPSNCSGPKLWCHIPYLICGKIPFALLSKYIRYGDGVGGTWWHHWQPRAWACFKDPCSSPATRASMLSEPPSLSPPHMLPDPQEVPISILRIPWPIPAPPGLSRPPSLFEASNPNPECPTLL